MMGFQEAVAVCLRKYATFSGRARRPEYWWFILFIVLVGVGLEIAEGVLFGFSLEAPRPVGTLFTLATFLPTLAVGWRRLHDIGKPGYYIVAPVAPLAMGVVPVLMPAISLGGVEARMAEIVPPLIVVAVIALYLLVFYWTLRPSDRGANRYGPEPGATLEVDGVFD